MEILVDKLVPGGYAMCNANLVFAKQSSFRTLLSTLLYILYSKRRNATRRDSNASGGDTLFHPLASRCNPAGCVVSIGRRSAVLFSAAEHDSQKCTLYAAGATAINAKSSGTLKIKDVAMNIV